MVYIVHETITFSKIRESLDNNDSTWIEKIRFKLEINPTGTTLGFPWFREKKHHDKRLFFIIDYNEKKILLVAFASKKEQQEMINYVKEHREELFRYLRSL